MVLLIIDSRRLHRRSSALFISQLPAVLLPVQQEKIDAQKKEADALVDSEQREWTDRRREIEAEVQQVSPFPSFLDSSFTCLTPRFRFSSASEQGA